MTKSVVRRVALGCVASILIAFAAGCASSLVRCDPDSVRKTYCYDMTARDDAFDLIQNLKQVEFLPLLREVAAMEYSSQRDFKQTWDLASIQRALYALTDFQDISAEELNYKRLRSDSWLQSVAIRNLQALEFWDATADVADLMRNTELNEEHLPLIAQIVSFLERSPETVSDICPYLATIATAYDDCFSKPDPGSQCRILSTSTRALEARFGCEAVKPEDLLVPPADDDLVGM